MHLTITLYFNYILGKGNKYCFLKETLMNYFGNIYKYRFVCDR